ncbi:MAG TPA: hypothetical protein ENI70_01410, partial [Candidatus Peregrinibacteria bacterium]|nr:hypothetical protein [Candidatus Peregrinibacteria bacterium]
MIKEVIFGTPFLVFAIAFSLGALCGSFANVVILRLRKGEQGIFKGRSHCVHCGHLLSPWDLIPVFSYAFLGGKCRHCKEDISLQYPVVEILTGLIFTLFAWRFLPSCSLAFWFLFGWALVIVSVYDLRFTEIPDKIILPLIGLTILLAIAFQFPLGISGALKGALIPFLFFGF